MPALSLRRVSIERTYLTCSPASMAIGASRSVIAAAVSIVIGTCSFQPCASAGSAPQAYQ